MSEAERSWRLDADPAERRGTSPDRWAHRSPCRSGLGWHSNPDKPAGPAHPLGAGRRVFGRNRGDRRQDPGRRACKDATSRAERFGSVGDIEMATR
jgi:hypothetical protein